jgi:hypothetical protein
MGENRTDDFSRRSFLKGTAAVSLGTAVGATSLGTAISAAWMAPAAAAELPPTPPHGAELRGMDLVVESPTTEGRFGFMFKNQPPHQASIDYQASIDLLNNLGATMEEQPTADASSTSGQKDKNDESNENPNPRLTSGFTFVGQFVDHDITFDTTLLDLQQSDPYATKNFRDPRYDLDSVYGLGPSVNPQFYDSSDPDKFRIEQHTYPEVTGKLKQADGTSPTKTWGPVTVYDVPRNTDGTAVIADPRNDQTLIILQLHVAMQKFHNRLVDVLRMQQVPRSAVFESARRLARWHYQWIVIHEFLPAIVGQTTSDLVYKEGSKAPTINIKYYKPTNAAGRSFIPVEFAVAAYRFGHSITRPRYTVQDHVVASDGTEGSVSGVPLFGDVTQSPDNVLNGHRELPPRLKIQWSRFFNKAGESRTARPVRQFDTSLANPLFFLPQTALPDANSLPRLAQRNLQRGRKMNLPSGQQVARLMGVKPLTNAELSQSRQLAVKIPVDPNNVVILEDKLVPDDALRGQLVDLPGAAGWGGEAPLWFYILKEAEIVGKGREMGPVGGRIIAEVLVGLLKNDPNSYLYLQPNWKPTTPIAPASGQFAIADLLKFAQVWS